MWAHIMGDRLKYLTNILKLIQLYHLGQAKKIFKFKGKVKNFKKVKF